jgi:hypothetical protein
MIRLLFILLLSVVFCAPRGVIVQDTEGNTMQVHNKSLVVFHYASKTVCDGKHFLYCDSNEIANGVSVSYLIETDGTNEYAHMLFDIDGSAITQCRFYEASDRVGVTTQNIGNSNRNSSKQSSLTIHKGVTGGTADGTLLYQHKGGSATNQSRSYTEANHAEEIVLKAHTKYLLKINSFTDANLTNVKLQWYEEL